MRSPEEYAGTRMHMPDYPNEGALRGGHIPGAKSIPWARAINPDDGTFKTATELTELYVQDEQAQDGQADDRLLPHRRAQQPHLVRAQVPARVQERQELRRLVDGVGQLRRRADREVDRYRRARVSREAAGSCSTRSRCSTPRIARTCCSTTRSCSRTCRPSVATRPFDKSCLVPHCESEAYVWADPADGRHAEAPLRGREPRGHFGEGAGGDSRQDRCRGCRPPRSPPSRPTIVEQIFRQNISMGKGMGLMSMVQAVQALARRHT